MTTLKNLMLAAVVAAGFSLPSVAVAQAPSTMPVQGYLTDGSDEPLDGQQSLTFRLYDAATGGAELWSETLDVDVDSGTFVAYLGRTQGLEGSLSSESGLWLSVQVGGDAEMQPRIELGSVPFSHQANMAAVADTLQGFGPNDFARAGDVAWNDIPDVPSNLSEIAALNCTDGQVALLQGGAWTCAPGSSDTLSSLSCTANQIAAFDGTTWACVDAGSNLAGVASTGSFNDLVDVPADLADGDDDTLASLGCAAGEYVVFDGAAFSCVATDGTYAAVATTGSFNDLVDVPAGLLDGDSDTLLDLNCPSGAVVAYDYFVQGWGCMDDFVTPADADANYMPRDDSTLYIDSTNGRVGVGTTSPSVELDVNGAIDATTVDANTVSASSFQGGSFNGGSIVGTSVQVSGNAQANNFTYPGRKTSWTYVPASQFEGTRNGLLNRLPRWDGRGWDIRDGIYSYFMAGVVLPHNSRIDGITCDQGLANNAGYTIEVAWRLQRRLHSRVEFAPDTLEEGSGTFISGSNSPNGHYPVVDDGNVAHVINNRDYKYDLFYFVSSTNAPTSYATFYGCKIEYSVPSVLP